MKPSYSSLARVTCGASFALLHAALFAAQPTTNDTFTRSVANGWGSTPQSQAYSTSGGSTSDYSVNTDHAEVKLSTIANRLAWLSGVSATNYEGTVRIALDNLPTANYAFAGPVMRAQSANDYYHVRLKHQSTGVLSLTIQKIIAGSQTNLGSEMNIGSGYTAGQYYTVRFSAAGTNPTYLRAKAWPSAAAEPLDWQLEVTDSTTTLQTAGGGGVRIGAHSSFAPLNRIYQIDDLKLYNTAFVANLKTAITGAAAGDIIYFTGTHTANITTAVSGTATSPIIVRGIGNALLNTTGTTSGDALLIKHHYWWFDDFAIDTAKRAVQVSGGQHGVLNRIDATNTGIEAFAIHDGAVYWEIANCSADTTGLNIGDFGEGFYIGSAQNHWPTPTTPDDTHYITLRNCVARNTVNDPFDLKEGAHHVKFINCIADFSGIEPAAGAAHGDSGFYIRGDDIQLIGCGVHDQGHGNSAYALASAYVVANVLLNGIDYGNRVEFKACSATDIVGAAFEIMNTRSDGVKIYTDCTTSNVGQFSSGYGSYTQPAPGSFVELTW